MNRWSCIAGALALLAPVLGGCGSDATETAAPDTHEVVERGESAVYEFRVASDAEPAEGENTFHLTLVDLSGGDRAKGAKVTATTWMPSMGHGSPTDPVVTEVSPGVYEISKVVFTMPGLWEVRYRAEREGASDEAVLQYEIP